MARLAPPAAARDRSASRRLIAEVRACQGCGACLLTCPEHAIRPHRAAAGPAAGLAVLADRCTGCGECVEVCPVDAIALVTEPGPVSRATATATEGNPSR